MGRALPGLKKGEWRRMASFEVLFSREGCDLDPTCAQVGTSIGCGVADLNKGSAWRLRAYGLSAMRDNLS